MTNKRSAQTFLALIFLIGGIITVAGITLAFLASSFIDSGYGLKSSISAEAVADGGVQDAMLQLQRNPSFFNTSGYSLAIASNTATVEVTQASPSSGFITILSSATVGGHVRKVSVVLSKNTLADQLSVVSWQDVQ